ncbi:MAG TPA: alpha/beta hydrolase [Hyphomicrobiaceae bacterium]|nr:alpha/beta hydrolase [Hyphomicrobiaceae bacterium]
MLKTEREPARAAAPRSRVIALHCSGSGGRQWRALADALGDICDVSAPEHYGCESVGPWSGEHPFTLADEAARSISLIDEVAGKVHLVGHSYGGAVALHVALARPHRIASIGLYEPSAFHLLAASGHRFEAYAEISAVARAAARGVVTGNYHGAAAAFIDYWGGEGAWNALRPAIRDALVRWIPKAPLDFHALMSEPTPPEAYGRLGCPVLILRGEQAPRPTREITEILGHLLPAARQGVISGAGHMGPITHAEQVAAHLAAHIREAEARPFAGVRRNPMAA